MIVSVVCVFSLIVAAAAAAAAAVVVVDLVDLVCTTVFFASAVW